MTNRALEAAAAAGAGLGSVLQAGVAQVSEGDQFTWTLYKRLILPADGFVFWAPAATVSPPITGVQFTVTANGNLHLSQDTQQIAEANYALQNAVFTTSEQVEAFESLESGFLYVMTMPNGSLLAFNGQRMRNNPATLWHYNGRALFPFEATQVIASAADIPADNVVSDSLPIWLAMSTPELPVFPSFLVPQNQLPPYVAVDIQGTEAMGQAPLLGPDSTQTQLVTERAVMTFYGVRNNAVLDFQRAVLENSFPGAGETSGPYGIMNMPVPVDEKQPQSEFSIIAQRKTMDVQINYYQARTRDIARKLILSAFMTVFPTP